jgi:hypothetical protein
LQLSISSEDSLYDAGGVAASPVKKAGGPREESAAVRLLLPLCVIFDALMTTRKGSSVGGTGSFALDAIARLTAAIRSLEGFIASHDDDADLFFSVAFALPPLPTEGGEDGD